MKKFSAFLMLWLLCSGLAKAETEPNNTWNQANLIAVGATGTGTAAISYDEDWWRVVTPSDGKLTLNWSSNGTINLWCQIYDTLGVLQFTGAYTTTSSMIEVDGIAKGNYYIRFICYYSNESTTYSFTPSFTAAAGANDAENNDLPAGAAVLNLNDSVTGHIGYYHNSYDDLTDWWKVTTNKDGRLDYTLTSVNGQNVYAELIDGDASTVLSGSYTTTTATYTRDGLAPGLYYIRIRTFYTNEYAPYKLKNNLVLPANNTEGAANNNFALNAQSINLGDSVNGHIGYYYNGTTDLTDWYKVITPLDGQISVQITSFNGQNTYAELFDGDTTTILTGNYTTTSATYVKDGLAAGTYYVRIRNFFSNEFTPYSLKIILTTTITSDPEPNNTRAQALTINPGDSVTGHIGYYYKGSDDLEDWYKVTPSQDGRIDFRITSLNGQNVWAILYDNDGVTQLTGNYTTTSLLQSKDGLAAGTYYLKIQTFYTSEFAPYTLKVMHVAVANNDSEPNGAPATATPLAVGVSVNGHTNYYYNHASDTSDYYALTLPVDGKLSWTITSGNGQNVYATLYDHDGTTQLATGYTTTSLTQTLNNLGAGVYYVHVHTFYSNEFAPYTLSSVLEPMVFPAENPADNKFAATGTLLPANTPTGGHLAFYYDTKTDDTDWWVIGYDGTGTLPLHLDLEQNHYNTDYPYINWALFSDTAAAAVASGQVHAPTTLLNITGLAVGKYYLRLTWGFNTFGAYQLNAAYTEKCLSTATVGSSSQQAGCLGTITYNLAGGLAPYTVQLYKNNVASGSPVTANSTVTFNGLGLGSYNVKVYSFGASGLCNNTSATTVFAPPAVPVITAGGPTTFCQDGSVTLTSSAASGYSWSTGATTQSITVNTQGSYTVTISNAAGCTNTSAATAVTVNALPAVPVITPSGPTSFCQAGSVTLTSSAANGYLWSTSATTQAINVTTSGTFTVTVSNANGCTRTSAPVTVTVTNNLTWYADADGDTYGNPSVTQQSCTQPAGYVSNNTDCNDASGSVHPNAAELCNSIDDNCNGTTDEGCGVFTWYRDQDADTYGNPATSTTTTVNVAPAGYVANNTDCNDANAAVHPGAVEVCNGVDDNCNGVIDEGVKTTFYADVDGDTYGNPASSVQACSAPAGYVSNNTDCNDNNAAVHPGATEVCNGVDDNCNGVIDEGVKTTFYADADGDTYGNPASSVQACSAPAGYVSNNTDCNDNSAGVHPGATELCNGVDDNCNGVTDEGCGSTYTYYLDADHDGYGKLSSPLTSSSPTPPAGYVTNSTDCNDANASVHPGATELCNGIDDNCNGQVDEGVSSVSANAGADILVCNGVNHTTMNATGAGKWQIVGGSGGSLSSLTDPQATFTGVLNRKYTLRWKVTGSCGTATDDVIVLMINSSYVVTRPCGISGKLSGVCGTTQTYCVTPVAAMNTYTWSGWPAGTTIISQTNTCITVQFPASGFTKFQLNAYANMCSNVSAPRSVWIKCGNAREGFENDESTTNVMAYPNPSSGIFNIDFSDADVHQADLTLTDLQGRVVLQQSLKIAEGEMPQLDLSTFDNGIYILQVNTGSETLSIRLVKQQ